MHPFNKSSFDLCISISTASINVFSFNEHRCEGHDSDSGGGGDDDDYDEKRMNDDSSAIEIMILITEFINIAVSCI